MKQLGRKLIIGIVLIGQIAFSIYGGQPGAFLSYGASARSIGMGRAFVALANDASAAYANPAGMVQIPNIEGCFFQSNLYDAYQLTAFNVVYPMVDNYIGLSFTQLSSVPMELRDHDNVHQGTFTDSKQAIGLSYAQPLLLPNLSVGTSIKYLTRSLNDITDARVLGDLGALYRPLSFLSIGATIQNILDFQLDKLSEDKFHPSIKAGITYKDKNFILSYDIENDLNTWYLGAEYRIHPLLTLRAGLNYESTNFGFSSEFSGIRFDYAYSNDELGANNRFSINVGIGQMINEFQRTVASDWHQTATDKYREGFFLMALEDMKKAYILNPQNEDIIKKLAKLKKLEQLSDKLNLSLDAEKDIWPQYNKIKQLITDGQKDKAKNEVEVLLRRYPDNPNLIHLMNLINSNESEDKK